MAPKGYCSGSVHAHVLLSLIAPRCCGRHAEDRTRCGLNAPRRCAETIHDHEIAHHLMRAWRAGRCSRGHPRGGGAGATILSRMTAGPMLLRKTTSTSPPGRIFVFDEPVALHRITGNSVSCCDSCGASGPAFWCTLRSAAIHVSWTDDEQIRGLPIWILLRLLTGWSWV